MEYVAQEKEQKAARFVGYAKRYRGGGVIQHDYGFKDSSYGSIYLKPRDEFSTMGTDGSISEPLPAILTDYKVYDGDCHYTACFNSWVNRECPTLDATSYEKEYDASPAMRWKFNKRIRLLQGTVTAFAYGASLKLAKERVFYMIGNHVGHYIKTEMEIPTSTQSLQEWLSHQSLVNFVASSWESVRLNRVEFNQCCMPINACEMEKETMQGEATQSSSKANNTIVTRDETITVSEPVPEYQDIEFASSEPTATFDYAVNRLVPLQSLEVNTGSKVNDSIKVYYLPESLYTEIADTINLMPFENYIYSRLTCVMKFVVNANAFQCGKVICSVKFDSAYCDNTHNTIQAALCRPHVILDLAANNEGELHVPFRYHRALVRNVGTNNIAVRPSKYATVLVQVLSPLRTGKDNATTVTIRPYVTIVDASFAATSYRVKTESNATTEMEGLIPMITHTIDDLVPNPALHTILTTVEKLLTNPGKGKNRDKPTNLQQSVLIPHPSQNFGMGKGPMNVVPLRVNPTTMTSLEVIKPYEDDPKSTLDIARIWGLRTAFRWSQSMDPNKEIFQMTLDPSNRGHTTNTSLTPFEMMCNLYQFWSGTFELRFDFVSNSFHTGAIMIAIEFNRPTSEDATQMAKVASNYTKTFHLGDQKSVTVVVPYIYDTLWRRCNTPTFRPTTFSDGTNYSVGMKQHVATQLTCRVINRLIPTQTAPQEIDVMVYMRASESTRFHSLKQSGSRPTVGRGHTSFPRIINNVNVNNVNSFGETRREFVSAKTEMDSGEKEDKDPTAQFNIGLDHMPTLTNDSQHNIKDIIRRPVLLFYKIAVPAIEYVDKSNGSNYGLFIPVRPANNLFWTDGTTIELSHGLVRNIAYTPQSQLLNLFRFYRGSLRYSILVHGENEVFVTYLPHNGIEWCGVNAMTFHANNEHLDPIINSGLHTELIVPQVNPFMTFEAPYDTENNWTLNIADPVDIERCRSRDRGDYNSGHVVLSAVADTRVSVWVSVGDDFELCNFYGIPRQVHNVDNFPSDNNRYYRPKTEMDFRVDEVVTDSTCLEHNIKTEVMDVKIPKNVQDEIVGAAIEARETMQEIKQTIPRVNEIFEMLKKIATPFIPTTEGMQKFKVIKEILWALAHALVTKSWLSVGLSVMRSIIECLQIDDIAPYIGTCSDKLAKIFSKRTSTEAEATNDKATIVGMLVGIVGQVFRVKLDASKYTSVFDNISDKVTSAKSWGYMNQTLTYIQRIYGTMEKLIKDALGIVDPSVKALQLLCDQNKAIHAFMQDVNEVTNPVNQQLLKTCVFRTKYWKAYMQAIQINKLLTTAPPNYVRPALQKVCYDMIKHAQDNASALMSHPARPEPYCIQINGAAGIGKSHLSNTLAEELMSEMNPDLGRGGLMYTRQAGSKWWNGYRGEPVICYDDFLNLNESDIVATQLSELFTLKTRQDFIPEMAAVEKKEFYASPLVVLLLSNQDFPNTVANTAQTPEAVFRRRNLLIKTILKEEYNGVNLRELPKDISENFGHLNFQLHNNPKDPNAGYDSKIYDWKDLLKEIKNRFNPFMEFEKQEVRKRLHKMNRMMGGIEIGEIDLIDPFSMFYRLEVQEESTQPGWVPSIELEKAVDELSSLIDHITRSKTEMDQPDEMKYDLSEEEITQMAPRPTTCNKCDTNSNLVQNCRNHYYCRVCNRLTNLRCKYCIAAYASSFVKKIYGKFKTVAEYVFGSLKSSIVKSIAYCRHLVAKLKQVDNVSPIEEHNPLNLELNIAAIRRIIIPQQNKLPKCYHREVIDSLQFVTYNSQGEGSWKLLVDQLGVQTYLEIPNRACSEDCPFARIEVVSDFLKEHVDMHKEVYLKSITAYYNTQVHEDVYRQRIPCFLRPPEQQSETKSWYEYLGDIFVKYRKFFVFAGAIIAVVGSINSIVNSFGNIITISTEDDMYEKGVIGRIKRSAEVKRIRRNRIAVESDFSDDVLGKIMRNYVIMRFWLNETEIASCSILGVRGNQAILPRHSLMSIKSYVEKGAKFTIEPATHFVAGRNIMRSAYTYDPKDFKIVEDTDLASMTFPSSFPLFKDIYRFFATDKDMDQHLPAEGCLVLTPTRSRASIHIRDVDLLGIKTFVQSDDDTTNTVFVTDLAISYDHHEKGACGSALVLENRARPIVSMHVAGSRGVGYGVIITQNLLDIVLRKVTITEMEEPKLVPISSNDKCFLLDESTRVLYLGLVDPKLKPHIPNASNITPSAIQGINGLKPEKQPAILSPTDIRYKTLGYPKPPLWYGACKHGIQTLDFPSSQLERVANQIWDMRLCDMKPHLLHPKRLSFEQAVVGIPGHEFYDPIRLNTSAGYPWQRLGSSTTKEAWIEPIRDTSQQMIDCKIHPKVIDELKRKEALRLQGIVPCTIFVDTLKDETRKHAKVMQKGGTRVFCASPLDYTIAQRQNLLHFCATVMKQRLNVHCGVGINAKGTEWTALFNYLAEVSITNIVTFDYSDFGPALNAQVAYYVAKLITKWCVKYIKGVNETEIMAILMECINSVHCAAGTVYQQFCGSPSGAPITTIINSMVNIFYIYLAWDNLIDEFNKWQLFEQHVRFVVYGDDLIMSVSNKYCEFFNALTLSAMFARYKIVATDASKSKDIIKYTPITEATFLKRGFKLHPNGKNWMAPLEWTSINDTTQWVQKSSSLVGSTLEACSSAILEAHAHGKVQFDIFKDQINSALGIRRIRDKFTISWEEVDKLWFEADEWPSLLVSRLDPLMHSYVDMDVFRPKFLRNKLNPTH